MLFLQEPFSIPAPSPDGGEDEPEGLLLLVDVDSILTMISH